MSAVDEQYEQSLLRGVYRVLQMGGHHLVCFVGGGLQSYHRFEAQGNVLYDLIKDRNVDGVILSGSLAHTTSRVHLLEFCQRFTSLPRAAIALDVPGLPSVAGDGYQGMADLTRHLIEEHQYQHFAFIRGPLRLPEADTRYQAFHDVLTQYHLQLPSAWIGQGDYTRPSGAAAMRQILSSGIDRLQAVVCANDAMAFGVLEVLQEFNLRVPEDVALTGFDDTYEAQSRQPGLTSIQQIPFEHGVQAARLVLQQLVGQPVPAVTRLPTRLILRQSCGCDPSMLGNLPVFPSSQSAAFSAPAPSSLALTGTHHATIKAAMLQVLHPSQLPEIVGWPDALLAALQVDLVHEDTSQLVSLLPSLLDIGRSFHDTNQFWQRLFTVMRQSVRNAIPLDQHPNLESWIHTARLIVAQHLERLNLMQRIRQQTLALALRELSQTMLPTSSLVEFLDVAASKLPGLGITACFLSLFETLPSTTETSRLILHWDKHGRRPLKPGGIRFASHEIIPGGFANNQPGLLWIVEALYTKEERLGFVVMALELEDAQLCDQIQVLLSATLQRVMLMHHRQQADDQLRRAYLELQDKARALETFAYSISHDLKGPLRGIDGYSHLLQEEYYDQLSGEGQFYIQSIRTAAERMNQMIDDLLEYSRLERRELQKTMLHLPSLIDRVVAEFETPIRTRSIRVGIDLQCLQTLGDIKGLEQAIRNLLDNAIKFTQTNPHPVIEIGSQKKGYTCLIWVKDNGIGFDMRYHERIFDIFQRLNRQEDYAGTGIGLALVRKVADRLGGRIWAESAPGEGATFFLELPYETSNP